MSGGLVKPTGISTGTYLGISLVETLIREQQRQAPLQSSAPPAAPLASTPPPP